MNYQNNHSREAPFIPPPEQSIFERVAPQGESLADTLAQEQNAEDERTHPEHDVVDTWHMGQDVPTVLERSNREETDRRSKS
ncbi:hypothetical protein INT44_003886 [Umbelopsis vinacea]|uniref:Uncharacterized protein n=1 Tax=Umbelopsis vinacea TaxID=44442 RepID=A0A8H7Q9Z4_9FUNG|nr:hypothetical protein INT44_003886 [Umbelopsis vinacea]